MFPFWAEPLIIAPIAKGPFPWDEMPLCLNLLDEFQSLFAKLMKFFRSPGRFYLAIEREVGPDQSYFLDILPSSLHPHLIESKLPIRIDIFLGWKPIRCFIVMDFEDGIVQKGQTINNTSNPITLFFFQREINVLFKTQGPSLIKWIITFVIIGDTFLSQTVVIFGIVFLSYNLNHLTPILLPALMIKGEKFLQGIGSRHFQISVEFLQCIMNPRTHESLNPFGLGLDFINISEFILLRTGFISRELRVRIGRHPSPPLVLVSFQPKDLNFIFLTRKTLSVKNQSLLEMIGLD